MTMAEEGFLRRWARRKTETRAGIEPAPEPAAETAVEPIVVESPAPRMPATEAAPVAHAAAPIVLPTMDDVAQLTSESDFSAFVARGVDQAVRRSALKKLFADPHFNVMDKLDMYMDDYNVASPMPADMLASLKHSKSFFDQAAEDARKRAEAQARAEAGGVLAASPPVPEQPGPAEAAQVQVRQDGAQAIGPPDVPEMAVLQAETHIVPESDTIMQKQP
ncbi:DUF3306 domain-containing protein [Herbaspirillum sp. SJZ107]|uniref:DUF3306 domain-containing protein n=1 Tax=Herbaspirillum sp. SJZ107 TaxID=2572881 RepID=UPI001169B124|nr:DUF3306 domain-containing protein [Herbaspirillum sp. SJZ107]TQK03188.1 uncharacterized protein DUF3306 [Herbaspirillum sp. SJZ107]